MSQPGNRGCITYLANVRDMIAFVVGLQIDNKTYEMYLNTERTIIYNPEL